MNGALMFDPPEHHFQQHFPIYAIVITMILILFKTRRLLYQFSNCRMKSVFLDLDVNKKNAVLIKNIFRPFVTFLCSMFFTTLIYFLCILYVYLFYTSYVSYRLLSGSTDWLTEEWVLKEMYTVSFSVPKLTPW